MSRTNRWTALIAVMMLPAGLSCGDAPTAPAAPVPGSLTVSLDGGAQPAGGVLLLLKGPGIGALAAANGEHHLFSQPMDEAAAAYRVALVGARVAGPLFSFDVPDVNSAGVYSVSLIELADASNEVVTDKAGYRLSVLRSTGLDVPEVLSK